MSRARLSLVALAGALAVPTAASASDGHVTYLEPVGPSERPMVVAGSDRGVAYIDAEHHLFRAFHHEQRATEGTTQPFLWVEDIDADGRDEVVGAGIPSFVIEDNADPIWGVLDGCDQYFVGDFIDDRNYEFLCLRGLSVRVWAYDGQEYFNWTGSGYNVTGCSADDFDSDRKVEVACGLSNGNHLFFDIADWFNDPSYEPPREGPVPEGENTGGVDYASQAAIAAGTAPLRVGSREISLAFAAGNLSMTVDGALVGPAAIGGSGIYSAASADLDGDGNPEIYVGGDAVVHVLRLDGSLVASVPANPDATRRDARVTVRSATANGLQDSAREAVMAVVEAGDPAFTACYSRQMGSDQFTRVGQMLYELTVNDSGRTTAASKRHSSLRNEPLESCIEGALEGLRFSPASEGTGTVSVSLDFDFVDVQ